MAVDHIMMARKEEHKSRMIKCSLCGYVFTGGQKNSCVNCPLNYGNCHFEKCPNCGYDMPQGSYLWTMMTKIINKVKRVKKND